MRFGLPQTSLSRGANQPVNGNSKTPVPMSLLLDLMWLWSGSGREKYQLVYRKLSLMFDI